MMVVWVCDVMVMMMLFGLIFVVGDVLLRWLYFLSELVCVVVDV